MRIRDSIRGAVTALVTAVVFAASAYQAWRGSAGTGLLSDPQNWANKKSPIYGEGGDSNLGGFPTGTYTLDADMTANRIVFDRSYATAVFDLGAANTLTLCGQETMGTAWAFGVTMAVTNSTLRLASGTIRVPYAPQAVPNGTNCVMRIPRENTAFGGFHFVVDGPDSVLKADYLYLSAGFNCSLSVVNGGYVTNTLVSFSSSKAPGNVLTVDGVGSRLDAGSITLNGGTCCGLVVTNGGHVTGALAVGASSSTSNSVLVSGEGSVYSFPTNTAFTLGGSVWSKFMRFEVTDGGSISNVTRLRVGESATHATGYSQGHVFAFRGAKTRQTLTPTQERIVVGQNYARQCRFEVTDGAQVMVAGSNKNHNRFWVGTGVPGVSNAVVVAGEGSLLSCDTTGAWLVGQHSRYNRLEIRDGGTVRTTNIITLGQGDNDTSDADENALVLANGGHLECVGIRLGFGDGSKKGHANRNRIELLSGSTVTNNGASNAQVWIGYYTNSCENVLRVSGGTLFSGMMVCAGRHGSGNQLIVENGGTLTVTNGTVRAGENANNVVTTSNRIEVLSGGTIITSGGVCLHGIGAGLTVSNGTIQTRGDVRLPEAKATCYATEPVISIAGTNSLVYTEGTITIASNAVLSLSVPAGGYLQPPFQTASGKAITINDLGSATFDLSDFKSGRTVLARAGGTLTVDAASLAKMNENLPESTVVKIYGKELVLARNTGMTVLFR